MEFVAGIPEGSGFALADGAFDAKKVLNELVGKGYLPVVKPAKRKPDGFGSKIRDLFFDESIYRYRSVGEGFFGAKLKAAAALANSRLQKGKNQIPRFLLFSRITPSIFSAAFTGSSSTSTFPPVSLSTSSVNSFTASSLPVIGGTGETWVTIP